jgi:hypothetical protein
MHGRGSHISQRENASGDRVEMYGAGGISFSWWWSLRDRGELLVLDLDGADDDGRMLRLATRAVIFLLVMGLALGVAFFGVPIGYYWWMQFQCWWAGPESVECWWFDLLKHPQKPRERMPGQRHGASELLGGLGFLVRWPKQSPGSSRPPEFRGMGVATRRDRVRPVALGGCGHAAPRSPASRAAGRRRAAASSRARQLPRG